MNRRTALPLAAAFLGIIVGCNSLPKDAYPYSVKYGPVDPKVLVVLDDFERDADRWTQRGDGSIGVSVRRIEGAPQGKYAAEIRFFGKREKGEKVWPWVNIFWYIDGGGWPADGKYLTFWAKAPAAAPQPCAIMLNIHEGPPQMQNEFFGATVNLTTEWKQYRIPADQFTTHIWGHKEGNKKLDLERSILVGINQRHDRPELTFPVTFLIDNIAIEKE